MNYTRIGSSDFNSCRLKLLHDMATVRLYLSLHISGYFSASKLIDAIKQVNMS